MSNKHLIVIGAGVAGLAAAAYARMNGYQVTVFEMHDLPGGLCTSWERKGYTFDGSIHYLFGSGEGQPFNRMWQELGLVQGRQFIHHQEYQRITDGDHTLIVYADPDRLQEHMSSLSPADAPLIKAFCDGVRQFERFDMSALYETPRPLLDANGWRTFGMKMLPFIAPMLRWANLPARSFAERFQHPFLRRAVAHMFSWEEAPVMMGMFLLAYLHTGNAGYPVGGSLAFARTLEARCRELGVEICYNAQVEKILVENGRAVGVRLYNNDVYSADVVLSAMDARSTLHDLLDGQYLGGGWSRMFDQLPTHSVVQLSYGVKCPFDEQPHWVNHLLEKPVMVAGEARHDMAVQHYGFDRTLAPEGHSSLVVLLRSDYHYWQNIYARKLYDTEQNQVSEQVLDLLNEWQPGLRAAVEVVDEATPMSFERYTGNWRGSTCGWLLSAATMPLLIKGVSKTLPGLDRFYMAGQWVEPGGSVALAAASGRNAVQLLCHADGVTFGVN